MQPAAVVRGQYALGAQYVAVFKAVAVVQGLQRLAQLGIIPGGNGAALGGTGLDAGWVTPELTTGCKILVAFFMFIGRVGPLAIFMFFVRKEKTNALRYPEERVIVG
jgi:trk system potassium uptake protein TrkH